MKKPSFPGTLLLLLSLFLLLPGCAEGPEREPDKIPLFLYSGGMGSPYASLGQEAAERINARSRLLTVTPQLSAGPEANLRLLGGGKQGLAIISGDLAYYAREGTEMFDGASVPGDFLLLARLDVEPLYLLAPPESTQKNAGSFKGKAVSLGQGGSRTQILASRLLEAYGLKPEPSLTYFLAEGIALSSLKETSLDAAFLLAPPPQEAVSFKILPYTSTQEEVWKEALPFAVEARVPAGTFSGQDLDLLTPAVPVFLAASRDLEPEILADLIRALKKTPYPLVPGAHNPGPGRRK